MRFFTADSSNAKESSDAGERRLWCAVLALAIEDLSSGNYRAVLARSWIASREAEPGSFLWICEELGLDPEAIRRRVISPAHAFGPHSSPAGRLSRSNRLARSP